MQDTILSVSELLAFINQTLEYAYPIVVVEGEVASFKVNKDKYIFFDIKDNESLMGCFMMAYQLRVPLEDGMKVQVVAQPRLTQWGKFSLTVREIRPVGQGSIKRSLQLLRAKLDKEGLFDVSKKRSLPPIPQKIALIASIESAGYADFVKIINARWGGIEVEVANVQVQGVNAADQIIKALNFFNQKAQADVIVIVRGGGSAEDLAVFNDEPLVRAVAASRLPTLIGVGHEVDTSLCDLAADVRAATPSNAAEIVVPDKAALRRELEQKQHRMMTKISLRLTIAKKNAAQVTAKFIDRLDSVLSYNNKRLNYAQSVLNQLNPKNVLKRGYGLIKSEGQIIKSCQQVEPGQSLQIELNDGIINVGVKNVSSK